MICPKCGADLNAYPKYFYCYRCSSQFKENFFGKLKEVKNTIASDQKKAMGR